MLKNTRIISCCFLGLLIVACPSLCGQVDKTSVTVQELLLQIQTGIGEAKAQIAKQSFPPLDSVTLTLQTEAKKDASGKFNLWFVKLGGGVGSAASSQMIIILRPTDVATSRVSATPVSQVLRDAIIGAAQGVAEAAKDPDVPLRMDSLSVELKFTVSKSGNAGIDVTLQPIGGGISGNISSSNVHALLVKFANPSKK